MSLHVGTSGWAYKEWKPDFYPADLKQTDFLTFYASRLNACEINATFYRLQTEDTFAKWVEAVPADFRFAIKVHRRLTHSRRIAPEGAGRDFLDTFFKSLAPLGDKLGCVLFQFPPTRSHDATQLTALLDALPDLRCAFEFRHDSWINLGVSALLAERGHTLCIADTTGDPPERLPDGPIAYVRLRHQAYTSEQRDGWRNLLAADAGSRDVYAFAKHEGVAAGDPFAGVGLADWLALTLAG